jgi:hypothetical protein
VAVKALWLQSFEINPIIKITLISSITVLSMLKSPENPAVKQQTLCKGTFDLRFGFQNFPLLSR